jgi:hypothetical protein
MITLSVPFYCADTGSSMVWCGSVKCPRKNKIYPWFCQASLHEQDYNHFDEMLFFHHV